jgi:adenine-specific DNA-methyltransferase
MALVEDLVKDIADPRLRNQIAGELGKLKARKKFGLVFEEHLPEVVQLPSLAIKQGARVVKRKDKREAFFIVTGVVNGKKVLIVPERGGPVGTAAKEELVVVKKFGEPMYPALVPVDRVTRAPGKPYHTLINADNFHALQLLLYCYEGRVDVIYIDPPYNTGARDWKYNNDYVDKTDTFRHSKWLSMMKKRLLLAKPLLKPEGIMIVTIDDYEVHHLRMLIEHEIPGLSVAGAVAIKTSPSGRPTLRGFRTNHEYALFVVTSSAAVIGTLPRSESQAALFKEEDEDGAFMWANLRKRGGANTLREARPKQFYPIYVSGSKIRVPKMEWKKEKRAWKILEAPKRNEKALYPMGDDGKERIWSLGHETLRDALENVRIVSDRQGQVVIQRKIRASEEGSQPSTFWDKPQYSIVEHGTVLLERILGSAQAFPFPKSIYAVADCLRVAGAARENALILDFFGGSGTTVHATALLNAEDNGNRQCILVTNNEVSERTTKELVENGVEPGTPRWEAEGICEAVTWPRIRACFTGKRPDGKPIPNEYIDGRAMSEGFEENATYYRLDFLDPAEVKRGDMYSAILPILWMMAGASGDLELCRGSSKYHFPRDCRFCVLLQEDHFKEFAAKLAERTDITHVFLVTDSVEAFHEMRGGVGNGKRCVQLYKSYLDNFKINLEPIRAD